MLERVGVGKSSLGLTVHSLASESHLVWKIQEEMGVGMRLPGSSPMLEPLR